MQTTAKKWIRAFLKDEKGVTAIEYCVAAAFIGATIIGSLSAIGPQISDRLGNAFNPTLGPVALGGDGESQSDGNDGACSGNCGIGVGNGGGNGTENEGQGKGPGAEKKSKGEKGKKH